ncbi:MAG: metallophosphoesterase family protein, partial [Selenomonadaceae bacterium]|nr:metallophosphoesterase family protein [Selenomonadaceae bacterium]
INASKIPFVIARGNGDSEVDQLVLEVPVLIPYAHVFANGKRIVVNHGHLLPTDADKDKMAKNFRADIFITGHIHKPVLEKRGATIFLNPGTVSPYLTNQPDKRTSVALITDDKIQIFDLDTDEIFMSLDF